MPIEKDFYIPIYRILMTPMDEQIKISKLSNWLLANYKNIKISKVKDSFRKAGRDDLINYFIEDTDIEVGDPVMSRATSRKGHIKEIKSDGETFVVKWDAGGTQLLSKEMVIKLNKNKIDDKKDFSNVKTPLPGYERHTKKDTDIDVNTEVTTGRMSEF